VANDLYKDLLYFECKAFATGKIGFCAAEQELVRLDASDHTSHWIIVAGASALYEYSSATKEMYLTERV